MGDRIAVMRMGRFAAGRRPQRLYDEPANLFVAAFIGSPAMNLFGRPPLVGGARGPDLALGSHHIAFARRH